MFCVETTNEIIKIADGLTFSGRGGDERDCDGNPGHLLFGDL